MAIRFGQRQKVVPRPSKRISAHARRLRCECGQKLTLDGCPDEEVLVVSAVGNTWLYVPRSAVDGDLVVREIHLLRAGYDQPLTNETALPVARRSKPRRAALASVASNEILRCAPAVRSGAYRSSAPRNATLTAFFGQLASSPPAVQRVPLAHQH